MPGARDPLNLALADAIEVIAKTNMLPGEHQGWIVAQLAAADACVAAVLTPVLRERLPREAPKPLAAVQVAPRTPFVGALVRTLTLALDALVHNPAPEARATAHRAVLEQLAAVNAEVAAGLAPGVPGQQTLVSQ
jgi:hypothetical protein